VPGSCTYLCVSWFHSDQSGNSVVQVVFVDCTVNRFECKSWQDFVHRKCLYGTTATKDSEGLFEGSGCLYI
jgi:hypothetical protein